MSINSFSEFMGINAYPSFHQFEDDVIIQKSSNQDSNSSCESDKEKSHEDFSIQSNTRSSNELKRVVNSVALKIFSIKKQARNKDGKMHPKLSPEVRRDIDSCKLEVNEQKETFSNGSTICKESVKNKKKRFAKNHDKVLFNEVREVCNQLSIDIFKLPADIEQIDANIKQALSDYCARSKWKGSIKDLYSRILKRIKSGFSVREKFELAKMYK